MLSLRVLGFGIALGLTLGVSTSAYAQDDSLDDLLNDLSGSPEVPVAPAALGESLDDLLSGVGTDPVPPPTPPSAPSPNPLDDLLGTLDEPVVDPAPAIEPIPAPVDPTPMPIEPIPAPIEPIPAPIEPIPAPIEPIPAPIEPIPAPVDPSPFDGGGTIDPSLPIAPTIPTIPAVPADSGTENFFPGNAGGGSPDLPMAETFPADSPSINPAPAFPAEPSLPMAQTFPVPDDPVVVPAPVFSPEPTPAPELTPEPAFPPVDSGFDAGFPEVPSAEPESIDDLLGEDMGLGDPDLGDPGFGEPDPSAGAPNLEDMFPDEAGEGEGEGEAAVTVGQETVDEGPVSQADQIERDRLREILERREKFEQAKKDYKFAIELYGNNNYDRAIQYYQTVIESIPDVEQAEFYKKNARQGIADCYLEQAKDLFNNREQEVDVGEDIDKLIGNALAAVKDHPGSLQLQKASDDWMRRVEGENLVEKKYFNVRGKRVDELINKGKELYRNRDYDNAEVIFENILFYDRYNKDALVFLEKIGERRYEMWSLRRRAEYNDKMAEVRESWLKPDGAGGRIVVPPTEPVQTEEDEEEGVKVLDTMDRIIIPELNFKDATIYDVVSFLVETTRERDTEKDSDGVGVGVDIIVDLNNAGSVQPQAAPAAPADNFFGDGGDGFGAGAPPADNFFGGADDGGFADTSSSGAAANVPKVSITLRRVSLRDALDFISDITGLKYIVKNGVVVLRPKNAVDEVVTRFYPVDPQVFAETISPAGGGGGGDPFGGGGADPFGGGADPFGGGAPAGGAAGGDPFGQDVGTFFGRLGVPTPPGTSIVYQPRLGQIVVVNSIENHQIFEKILKQINKPPVQVEIESRFVEVLQNDLEELGIEWKMTDPYEIAIQDGVGPLSSRPRVQVDQNDLGFTRALRFFNFDGTSGAFQPNSAATRADGNVDVGNVLSLSSVLTNPELQMVLHAINQKGSMDLLSAPRITTLSGVNAQIEVVREIIYPTEFEIEQSQFNQGGGGVAGGVQGPVTPPAVTPGAFETRETGVILNVTPTVAPDNYTINLALIPEIAELVDWIQYGSTVGLPDGSSFVFNIPQPIFASRNVTTSMVVWDGHSVVMGGLIREDLVAFDDRIPLLGDIPGIGRLFRSEGQRSEKRNLLIFVSARLVDPSGKPINPVKNSNIRYKNLSDVDPFEDVGRGDMMADDPDDTRVIP